MSPFKKLAPLFILCSLLLLGACSSEYTASEISVSDQGLFVERGSDDQLDGVVVIDKSTGERLSVEFDDGMPSGDIEMYDAAGEIVVRSQFAPKKAQASQGGFASGFVNENLEKNAASLTTHDYLNLFEEFAEYDGDYLEVDSNNKKTKGYFDEGEKIGRWQVYCENEQLQSDRTFERKASDDSKASVIKVNDEIVNTCDGHLLLSATRDKQGRLQGAYIENAGGSWLRPADSTDKPLPKYQRNYVDNELDGDQKEFDRYGLVKLENQYAMGVKQGVEKIYSSSQNYQTKETEHWLSEVKNYTNGQLNGSYTRLDKQQRPLETGQYTSDKAVGTWKLNDYSKHSQQLVDFDSNNFILDKAAAFKQACYLPKSSWSGTPNWASNYQGKLTDCEYYVENTVVDINKKLALDVQGSFEKSRNWTYAAIVAAPKAYAYMKKHGLKTRVSDSTGRTRLHACLTQLRAQNRTYPRCTAEQAIDYMADVDINHVSNTGTALHQLSLARNFSSRRAAVVNEELKIAKALIAKGADVDQVNHQKKSPLMAAVSNGEYALAEMILDAGASVSETDSQGKSALSYFFINGRNRWLKSKVSAQGTRVLAKMVALGVDPDAIISNNKTVRDFSEENNTLHHIQTLKDANAMSVQFKDSLTNKLAQRQATKAASAPEQSSVDPSALTSNAPTSSAPINSDAQSGVAAVIDQVSSAQGSQAVEPVVKNELSLAKDSSENSLNNSDAPLTEEAVEPEPEQVDSADTAQRLLNEQADFLVEQAREHIANFRLQTPKTNSALGSLEQLKRIAPQSPKVEEIEQAIGDKYLSLASSKIKQGDKAAAQKHLRSANSFIKDQQVLNEYQARVDAITVKPAEPVAKVQEPSQTVKSSFACNPVVKAIGVPMLGRTFIARQSFPLSKQEILSKSLPWIKSDYSNVRQSSNGITFEQPTKRKPIKAELQVMRDGNNTQLTITTKTPPGFVVKKADYKKTFCDLIATF